MRGIKNKRKRRKTEKIERKMQQEKRREMRH